MTLSPEKEISVYPRVCDCDLTGAFRYDSFLVLMQELAGEHARELGAGFDDLRQKDLAWVSTRMQLEIEALPTLFETFLAKTWTGKERHGIYPRCFAFYDKEEKLLASATVFWALMDLSSRKMSADSGITLPVSDKKAIASSPKGLRCPEDAPLLTEERQVRYADSDVNGHMNNTKYLSWLCDLLPLSFFAQKMFSKLTLNYFHELAVGAVATLSLYETEDGYFFSVKEGETLCFAAAITVADKRTSR